MTDMHQILKLRFNSTCPKVIDIFDLFNHDAALYIDELRRPNYPSGCFKLGARMKQHRRERLNPPEGAGHLFNDRACCRAASPQLGVKMET